jgi:hypothetical protein
LLSLRCDLLQALFRRSELSTTLRPRSVEGGATVISWPFTLDEHLVEVLNRIQIIHSEEIIYRSLSELKNMIATFFESDLKRELEKSVQSIVKQLGSIREDEQN